MHRRHDVLQAEAPVVGEQSEVLCRRGGRRRRSVPELLDGGGPDLRAAEDLDIGRGKLTASALQHPLGPPTADPGHERKGRIHEVPGPPGHAGHQLVEAHHLFLGTSLIQRSHAAHDGHGRDPVGKKSSTGRSEGSAARVPDDREPVDLQVIGQGRDIRDQVRDVTVLGQGAVAVPGAVEGEQPDARRSDRLVIYHHLPPRSRGAVQGQHRGTRRLSDLHPGQLPPIGQPQQPGFIHTQRP